MSFSGAAVRFLRHITDVIAPFSFNRIGFEFNRLGFDEQTNDAIPTRDARRRIALVTGANSGIGFATARALASRGLEVWLLCRNEARGTVARDEIAQACGTSSVHLAVVDLSSLASIRRCVRELPVDHVDVLVHNAGAMPEGKQLTEDGVELTFATNLLGPLELTRGLRDRLSGSPDARVIFVSSGGMYLQRLDLVLPAIDPADFDGTRAYANAKRAQVVLGRLLAERWSGGAAITFASMHPGWVDTTVLRDSLPTFHAKMRRFLRTAEQGADTIVWLATSDKPRGTQGELWFDRRIAPQYPVPFTRESDADRARLLPLCEEMGAIAFEGEEALRR